MNSYRTRLSLRLLALVGLFAGWNDTLAQRIEYVTSGLEIRNATDDDSTNAFWLQALAARSSLDEDSISNLSKTLTVPEADWYALITSRKKAWESMIDSLARPFESIVPDKIIILTGSHGEDDAFTFGDKTICFDLNVLAKNYGNAKLAVNQDRVDRLFAHEITHLFHRAWMRSRHLSLITFRDSVLWECIYEGLGTYRSLSTKWLPRGDSIPEVTEAALKRLIPEFLTNIEKVCGTSELNDTQKANIARNLSRGAIAKKWGAFTVAIWIAVFVGDDEKKLKTILQWGIDAPILLAIRNVPMVYILHDNLMRCISK